MLYEQISETYEAVEANDRPRFLADLAFQLTIAARDFGYTRSPNEALPGMQLCNELQHQILSMLGHLLDGSSKRYPDDVFCKVLAEKAESGHFEDGFRQTFEDAVGRLTH